MAKYKIEKELEKYIEELNKTMQKDYGDRYEVVLTAKRWVLPNKILFDFDIIDHKQDYTQSDVTEFFKLGKKYLGVKLWDIVNKFVYVRNYIMDEEE